jgi:hypothetical protein
LCLGNKVRKFCESVQVVPSPWGKLLEDVKISKLHFFKKIHVLLEEKYRIYFYGPGKDIKPAVNSFLTFGSKSEIHH